MPGAAIQIAADDMTQHAMARIKAQPVAARCIVDQAGDPRSGRAAAEKGYGDGPKIDP